VRDLDGLPLAVRVAGAQEDPQRRSSALIRRCRQRRTADGGRTPA
jgi:hypothetical protein